MQSLRGGSAVPWTLSCGAGTAQLCGAGRVACGLPGVLPRWHCCHQPLACRESWQDYLAAGLLLLAFNHLVKIKGHKM